MWVRGCHQAVILYHASLIRQESSKEDVLGIFIKLKRSILGKRKFLQENAQKMPYLWQCFLEGVMCQPLSVRAWELPKNNTREFPIAKNELNIELIHMSCAPLNLSQISHILLLIDLDLLVKSNGFHEALHFWCYGYIWVEYFSICVDSLRLNDFLVENTLSSLNNIDFSAPREEYFKKDL